MHTCDQQHFTSWILQFASQAAWTRLVWSYLLCQRVQIFCRLRPLCLVTVVPCWILPKSFHGNQNEKWVNSLKMRCEHVMAWLFKFFPVFFFLLAYFLIDLYLHLISSPNTIEFNQFHTNWFYFFRLLCVQTILLITLPYLAPSNFPGITQSHVHTCGLYQRPWGHVISVTLSRPSQR